MNSKYVIVLSFLVLCCNAKADQCSINFDSLQFGEYDMFSPIPLDASSNMEISCDVTLPISISMDAGVNGNGNFFTRQLQAADGVSTLRYNIFSDASFNSVWGDGTGGTFKFQGIAGPSPLSISVYGRIPEGQNIPAGSYRDSIVISVDW